MAQDDHGRVLLFQGDSITDAGRNRTAGSANNQAGLGSGYPLFAAARLLDQNHEGHWAIYNRGVSGNKVFQLAERWQKECLDLKPDVVSILIGVNDIWHKLSGNYDGDVTKYENDYHTLLDRTRGELPQVELVVCEPFVLKTGAVNDTSFPEFDKFRAAARRQAKIFGATFVPFQSMFDEAVKEATAGHWLGDGVHPTMAGHHRMARTWYDTVIAAGK